MQPGVRQSTTAAVSKTKWEPTTAPASAAVGKSDNGFPRSVATMWDGDRMIAILTLMDPEDQKARKPLTATVVNDLGEITGQASQVGSKRHVLYLLSPR